MFRRFLKMVKMPLTNVGPKNSPYHKNDLMLILNHNFDFKKYTNQNFNTKLPQIIFHV